MAVTSSIVGKTLLAAYNKEVDLLSDTIAVKAYDATDTFDMDVDDYENDLTGEKTTANGYTAGGQTAASKTNTYTGATNVFAFDFADVVWTATGTLTIRKVAVIDTTPGTTATNPVLTEHVSDVDVSATDAAWTFAPGASGLFTITI